MTLSTSQAHFATLKCLLRGGDRCVGVDFDAKLQKLTVRIDRLRIIPHGKAALGKMLLHLHMYRSLADVKSCHRYYEDLSAVDGVYLEWREAGVAAKQPKWLFVQPNTFLENFYDYQDYDDCSIRLKEYEASPRGIIQGWVERKV